MVNLSLQHRVKLERQASLLSEVSNETPRRIMLAIAATIANINVLFVIAGAVLADIIDYSWYHGPGAPESGWYRDEHVVVNRAATIFFYMTIPCVVSTLSIYEAIYHWRSIEIRPAFAVASGSAGLMLWVVQYTLWGSCVWPIMSAGGEVLSRATGVCPYSLSDLNTRGVSSSGLEVASYVLWFVIAVFVLYITHIILGSVWLIRRRKMAGKPPVIKRSYAYQQPVEDTEVQTDRDMPDRSAAPSPEPLSVCYETVIPEKGIEMV